MVGLLCPFCRIPEWKLGCTRCICPTSLLAKLLLNSIRSSHNSILDPSFHSVFARFLACCWTTLARWTDVKGPWWEQGHPHRKCKLAIFAQWKVQTQHMGFWRILEGISLLEAHLQQIGHMVVWLNNQFCLPTQAAASAMPPSPIALFWVQDPTAHIV